MKPRFDTLIKNVPHVDFGREVTVGHLLLEVESSAGCYAKVNLPIRPRGDVERLWEAVVGGDVDWIVSDHACCGEVDKLDPRDPRDVFAAKAGFGGTEDMLSGVVTEGCRRGLSLNRVVELLAYNVTAREVVDLDTGAR